ncbi:hypothetical protein Q3G72_008660 [Acer saccharum]|nr:hypothetical protein Q3G72_008660 [Acer saccharum]
MLENVLSSSSSGLCSLRNNFESLSLKHFTSLTTLDISYCERLKYLQEFPLPSRLEFVDTSYCISLETLPDTTVVSTGEWDISQHFQTDEILAVAPEARNCWRFYRKDQIRFFGSEILEWVRYQNEGSSLTIDLPPHWYINNFFGIVLCIVASCDSCDGGYSSVDYTCNFIDSDFDCQEYISNFEIPHPKWDLVSFKYSKLGEDDSSLSSMYSLYQKVRFQFSPRNDCCKVKKCGVHLVLGIQRRKHREEDQEEDSQKRIKQWNIVHEVKKFLINLCLISLLMIMSNGRVAHLHLSTVKGPKMMKRRVGIARKGGERRTRAQGRPRTHQMDDQDDAAGENTQDLLAAAGLEDSDAEDEMAAPSSAAVQQRVSLFCNHPPLKWRRTVKVTSSLTGPITIEDVAYENSDPDVSRLWPSEELKFRCHVSQRTQGLVQSEALLIKDGLFHKTLKVYHGYFASPYHMGIISGFILISSYLENIASTAKTVRAVVAGLRAGLLPMFLHGRIPFLDIEVHFADGIQFVTDINNSLAADEASVVDQNDDASSVEVAMHQMQKM